MPFEHESKGNKINFDSQRPETHPRWYPNKSEEIEATSMWGKECFHEGFPISFPFSKRTEVHTTRTTNS